MAQTLAGIDSLVTNEEKLRLDEIFARVKEINTLLTRGKSQIRELYQDNNSTETQEEIGRYCRGCNEHFNPDGTTGENLELRYTDHSCNTLECEKKTLQVYARQNKI